MSRFARRRAPTACWRRRSPHVKARANRHHDPSAEAAEEIEEKVMNTAEFPTLVSRHRNYFLTGATRSVEWRESQLTALRAMMTDRAEHFYASLWTDLRRNRTDADLTDVKYMTSEADH